MAKAGKRVTFHGAFASRAKAQAKARKVRNATVKQTTIRGQRRFLVQSKR